MFIEANKARRVAILALLLVGTAAAAAPRSLGEVREQVRVSDLNLASPAGQRVVQRRIEAAVKRVCDAAVSPVESVPRSQRNFEACRRSARAGAYAQLQRHVVPAAQVTAR